MLFLSTVNIEWNFEMPKEKNENFITRDLLFFNKKSGQTQANIILYSHVVIEWLREWPKDIQDEILTDGLLILKSN